MPLFMRIEIYLHNMTFCLFQLLVEAYDTQEPNNKGYATVIIKVERNEFGPEFQPTTYTVTKNDYDGIGEPVVTVNAIDKDITVRIMFFFKFSY